MKFPLILHWKLVYDNGNARRLFSVSSRRFCERVSRFGKTV